jgi:uncharacterized protein YgiM (DUF1202 family)
MKHMKKIVALLFLSLWIGRVLAQSQCADIVRRALETTHQSCSTVGRNEACYGNVQVDAQPQAWVTSFTFAERGDIENIAAVQSLAMSSQVEDQGIWGVAVMNIQANLPDTLPGQNVLFLLFGNVEITNGVETNAEPIEIQAAATTNANVRTLPSTQASVAGSLHTGETVVADGRLEDGSWLRVRLPEGGGGWVFADLLAVDGDVEMLNRYDPSTLAFGPMQAFYFQSGLGDSPCDEAPDSGILVQTPEGAGTITLSVNEVNIELGSTIYLQAQPGNEMIVNVVEGEAQVSAQGVTVSAPAGTRVRVSIGTDLTPNGALQGPEPYADADLAALPVSYLAREITVAPALNEEEIAALSRPASGGAAAPVAPSSPGVTPPPSMPGG